MVLLNGVLVNMVSVPQTSMGFYAIAPCVMVVCILSAFRGFIQGQQNMLPTAVSQLIEQVGKVFLSLPLAYIGLHHYHSLEAGAAGAARVSFPGGGRGGYAGPVCPIRGGRCLGRAGRSFRKPGS